MKAVFVTNILVDYLNGIPAAKRELEQFICNFFQPSMDLIISTADLAADLEGPGLSVKNMMFPDCPHCLRRLGKRWGETRPFGDGA